MGKQAEREGADFESNAADEDAYNASVERELVAVAGLLRGAKLLSPKSNAAMALVGRRRGRRR